MQRGLVLVEVLDIIPDAARVAEFHLLFIVVLGALIHKGDLEPFVQIRQLPQAAGYGLAVEPAVLGKDGVVGHEAHQRAALAGVAQLLQTAHGFARVPLLVLFVPDRLKAHLVMGPIPEGIHRHPFGKGVDHRRAHAVQAAGIGVVLVAELAARVQAGVDQLDAADVELGMLVHGHAAAIVPHRGAAVLMQGHQDLRGEPRQGLVDAVVHDLPQQMMQAAHAGGANVHARTHAHRVQPLQHLQLARVVAALLTFDLRHRKASCFHRVTIYYSICYVEMSKI